MACTARAAARSAAAPTCARGNVANGVGSAHTSRCLLGHLAGKLNLRGDSRERSPGRPDQGRCPGESAGSSCCLTAAQPDQGSMGLRIRVRWRSCVVENASLRQARQRPRLLRGARGDGRGALVSTRVRSRPATPRDPVSPDRDREYFTNSIYLVTAQHVLSTL